MHSSASIKTHSKMFATLPLSTKQGDQGSSNELHALAASIGTFLPAREPVEPVAISQENAQPHAPAAGDWRQATKNLSYEEELDSLIRNGHLLIGKSSPH